jgi:hypothetical protein
MGYLANLTTNMPGWTKNEQTTKKDDANEKNKESPRPKKRKLQSEATIADKVKAILNVLFENTDITYADGEIGCHATKHFRLVNEKFYDIPTTKSTSSSSGQSPSSLLTTSSMSSNKRGRRTDIIIIDKTTMNELAIIELKANKEPMLSLKQEGKCHRMNTCVDLINM